MIFSLTKFLKIRQSNKTIYRVITTFTCELSYAFLGLLQNVVTKTGGIQRNLVTIEHMLCYYF